MKLLRDTSVNWGSQLTLSAGSTAETSTTGLRDTMSSCEGQLESAGATAETSATRLRDTESNCEGKLASAPRPTEEATIEGEDIASLPS